MREAVPFGPSAWPLEIKFKQTAKGGTCSPGCHVERSYDHGDRPRSIPVVALTAKGQGLVAAATMPATAPAANLVGLLGQGSFPVPPPPFTPPEVLQHRPEIAQPPARPELSAHGVRRRPPAGNRRMPILLVLRRLQHHADGGAGWPTRC